MVFELPQILWLLVLAPLTLALGLRGAHGLPAWRRGAVALLRMLAVAAVVIAMARPAIPRGAEPEVRVAVVDLSSSIDDATVARVEQQIARDSSQMPVGVRRMTVVFGARAQAVGSAKSDLVQYRDQVGAGETALGDAIRLAGSYVPTGRGSLRVFTDGNETRGNAAAEVAALAGRGVGVEFGILKPAAPDRVIVQSATMPPACGLGETVGLDLSLVSAAPRRAKVEVKQADGVVVATRTVDVNGSSQALVIPVPVRKAGLNRFEVRVGAADDATGKSQGGVEPTSVCTLAGDPVRLAIVDGSGGGATAKAMSALLGQAAEVTSVSPDSLADKGAMESIDVLMLADVPAERFSADAQARVSDRVKAGMGLLVGGGPQSFGPGGYAASGIADLLPVTMPQQLEKLDPSTTLVIIIDTSGSMQGTRISLAKEVVRLALRRLQPHDKAGIVEFYGSKRWAAPIQSAANSLDLNRALNRLTAGGGTLIFPALEEAYYALKNVNTRTRHVLILTDGGVESGPFEQTSRRMAEQGITVSTVLCGPGQHSAFLANVAQWGRGRFYNAPDRFNLPEVLLKQTQTQLLPPYVEQPTRIEASKRDPLVKEMDWREAPALGGYVRTTARPTADVTLKAGSDPLLVRWRVGRGQVAAFTSQWGASWSGELGRWPGAGTAMSNLLRSISPHGAGGELDVHPIARAAGLEVDVTSRVRTASLPVLLEILSSEPGAAVVRQATLEPIAAGRWNALLSGVVPGRYVVKGWTSDGAVAGHAAAVVPVPSEAYALEANTNLIEAMKKLASSAGAVTATPSPVWKPVWVVPTAAAMVLMLLNVLIRRLPVKASPMAMSVARGVARAVAVVVVVLVASQSAPAQSTKPTTRKALRMPAPTSGPATRRHIDPAALKPDAIDGTIHDLLVSDGDVTPLVTLLKRKVEEQPELAESLAKAALEDGDLAAARAALGKLVAGAPGRVESLATLGDVLELAGEDAESAATFVRAIAAAQDAATRVHLRRHLAIILLDSGKAAEGEACLREMVKDGAGDPPARLEAAVIASAYGRAALSAELLGPRQETETLFASLLRGTCLLASDPEAARAQFEAALSKATRPRDRRFIAERLIAAARQGGKLGNLADAWLADPQLPADRLQPLLTVLRELGRVDDIVKIQNAPPASEEHRRVIQSAAFGRDAIAAALDAGRVKQAEDAYAALRLREPRNEEWLLALARLKLHRDDIAGADALLGDAIDKADTLPRLRRLTDAARQLGRFDLAERAALAWPKLDAASAAEGAIYRSSLARERGDAAGAVNLLKEAVPLAGSDKRLLMTIADAAEALGQRQQAITLLDGLAKADGAEDVLEKLAWLLELDQKPARAQDIWLKLWRSAQNAARRTQARNRVLDLASKTGTIADLAISLEDQLAAKKAGADELSLLVEIYAGANDPASAAEVLAQFRESSGGEVPMLRQLARLYLRCERFGQANQVLQKLVALDPDGAIDTLQQIAVLALERGRPVDAVAALDDIGRRMGTSTAGDEMRAGVLDTLGQFPEAARQYRRGLAANVGQVEEWLLWAQAMAKAGQKDAAVARLQVLADAAEADDLFIAALDGLLNLEAPRSVLRVAARRAVARLAVSPEKMALYQVAGDVAEASADATAALRVQEISLLIAGEQRTTVLRDLMTLSRSAGQLDRTMALGNTLLALGEEVPPQVFLELGQLQLSQQRVVDAERSFTRAREAGEADATGRQVAQIYEAAGYTDLALRELRPLLRMQPTDIALRVRAGGLHEQAGQFDSAFDQYAQSFDLLLRRQSDRQQAAGGTTRPTRNPRVRRPESGASVSEFDQYFDQAIDGMIACCRTPTMTGRLLDLMRKTADTEIDAAKAEAAGEAPTATQRASDFGRLWLASAALRRCAMALHRPELADAFDARLLERFPSDTNLRQVLVQDRLNWGLFDAAAKLAGATAHDEVLTLRRDLAQGAATRPLSVERAGEILPRLILLGRTDEAAKALAAMSPKGSPVAISNMLTVAYALERPDLAKPWADAWLSAVESGESAKKSEELSLCIRTAWPALSAEARADWLARLTRGAKESQTAERGPLALMAMRVAYAGDLPIADADQMVDWAAAPNSTANVLAEVVLYAPTAKRGDIVRKVIGAQSPQRRRQYVLQFMGLVSVPLDEATQQSIVELYTAGTPNRAGAGEERYLQLQQNGWHRNPRVGQAAAAIAQSLLKESKGDAGVSLVVAGAMAAAGKSREADQLAVKAFGDLASRKQSGKNDTRMMEDALRMVSAKSMRSLLWDGPAPEEIKGDAMQWVAQGLVLKQLGRRDEAVAAFNTAFHLAPANMESRRLLLLSLEEDHRMAELSDIFSPFVGDEAVLKGFERTKVIRSELEMRHYDRAAKLVKPDPGIVETLQRIQVAYLRGDRPEALRLLRGLLIESRRERRSFTPFLQPLAGEGGLSEFLNKRGAERRIRWSAFQLLSGTAGAAEEFEAFLYAGMPGGRDVSGMVDGVVGSCAADPKRRDAVMATLADRKARGAFTRNDRLILAGVGALPGAEVPPALLGELDDLLITADRDENDALLTVASAYVQRGQGARAAAILRWTTAADLVSMRRARDSEVLYRRFETLAGAMPAEQRASAIRKLLEAAAPAPGDPADERTEPQRLDRLAEAEPAALARALSAPVRQGRVPSPELPRFSLLHARLAAADGDVTEMLRRVEPILCARSVSWSALAPLDIRLALPAKADARSKPLVAALRGAIVSAAQRSCLGADDAVRALALLGAWCAENSLTEEGLACLEAARPLDAVPGDAQLWLADLARMLKRDDVASGIEQRLLQARRLPTARVPAPK